MEPQPPQYPQTAPAAPAPPEPGQQYDTGAKVGNALTVTQPGERTICEIKRHPIGILGIYVGAGVLLITIAVLTFLVLPHFMTDSNGSSRQATLIGVLVFLIVAMFSLAFTYISTKVYWGNSWIVTTDSITQIQQTSLFRRQSAQLSLGNLEDITAEQNGVLTHMFNYGLLKVETAGERSKFVFMYCPNPNYYAQQILAAREAFEQGRRSEASYQPAPTMQQSQAVDPGYGAYQPPAAPPPVSNSDYPDTTDEGVNTGA